MTNRRLNLEPAMGNLAHDAGLVALYDRDLSPAPRERILRMVAMARRTEDLKALPAARE